MVIPLGERYQQTLYIMLKQDGRLVTESLRPTLFVPMTGAAEARREVLPNPGKPNIVNGSFEEAITIGDEASESRKLPAGWHYQRQTQLIDDDDAPDGERFLRFENTEAGRGCRALQAFGVDGRKVGTLDISLMIRGDDLRVGQDRSQWGSLVITFYDERRAIVGQRYVGPWRGTFDWQPEHARCRVPPGTREAILRIGLHGGRGTLDVDGIMLDAGP